MSLDWTADELDEAGWARRAGGSQPPDWEDQILNGCDPEEKWERAAMRWWPE